MELVHNEDDTHDEQNQIADFNGYVPRHDNARVYRIEWDHIVPVETVRGMGAK
jgi:hypothetical protein